jgi:hypothetical protein
VTTRIRSSRIVVTTNIQTSIGFAELGNAFFSAPRLKLEVDRVVENYLLSLRRSDSMLSDVVGVALIPLEHMLLPPNSRFPRRRLLNELS